MKKKIGDLTLRELQKYHDDGCVDGGLIKSKLCSGVRCSECSVSHASRLAEAIIGLGIEVQE